MVSDLVTRDRVLISMSPVIECKPFRKETIGSFAGREDIDLKQAVADRVMEQFNVF
jgi:hypothetical protein